MLQLIGWMGCIYLLVKGLEFFASSAYRDENGALKSSATIAIAVAWLGAAAMFFAFTVQGFSMSGSGAAGLTASEVEDRYPEKSAAWHDCVTAAKDAVEAAACKGVE